LNNRLVFRGGTSSPIQQETRRNRKRGTMIDLTEIEKLINDPDSSDGLVAIESARAIRAALLPFSAPSGKRLTKDDIKELNADLEKLSEMLFEGNRQSAAEAIAEFLKAVFGGGGGCGGHCRSCPDDGRGKSRPDDGRGCCDDTGDGCCGDKNKDAN
jgi:hypothetical protein